MNKIHLSKSKYCQGIQCEKILWLSEYKPKAAAAKNNESVFENGRQVGELAKGMFGYYEDIPFNKNLSIMIEKTDELLKDKPNIITEASFNYNNNFCMVDILKNDEDGVEIYEVKSSTSVTDIFIDDVSFQYFILSNLGLNVKKVCIVYINNQYIRKKELDLNELFIIQDITSIAKEKQKEIRNNVEMINKFMAEHDKDNEPYIPIGNQCSKPYKCDFWEYCNNNLDKYMNINLYEKDVELNTLKINKEAIKNLIDSLKYPLYFIDYEAYMTPIPEIEKTRPYQQLPFQFSLHILKDKEAKLEHKEFLAQIDDENFIRHFAESVIDNVDENGSVIVYNKTFEATLVNKELARMYPDLEEEFIRINNSMIDFMIPFRKKQYYTKEMQGSYSIKKVLPALYPDYPELNYENLPLVHESGEAPEAFLSLKNKSPADQEIIREGLLKYCKLDTYALVKIYEKFIEVINE